MPSEIAQSIVNSIFADEKSKAIDTTNDALSAATYDAIQAKKLEFAKDWGFDLGDTGQEAADDIADKVYDDQEPPELAPTAGELAQQEQEPEAVPDPLPPNTAVVDSIEPIEEPKNETDS